MITMTKYNTCIYVQGWFLSTVYFIFSSSSTKSIFPAYSTHHVRVCNFPGILLNTTITSKEISSCLKLWQRSPYLLQAKLRKLSKERKILSQLNVLEKKKIPKSHRKTWSISEYIASSSHTWLNKQQTLIRTGNSVFIAFICYTYKTYM